LNPELALIFDLDGVVIDSMPTHTLAWERYLEANGIDSRNVEARMHGKRNDDLVRDLGLAPRRYLSTARRRNGCFEK